jgi:hypothetical protein
MTKITLTMIIIILTMIKMKLMVTRIRNKDFKIMSITTEMIIAQILEYKIVANTRVRRRMLKTGLISMITLIEILSLISISILIYL